MTPRTRWQGWTLVYKDNGNLVLDPETLVPIVFPNKRDTELQKNVEEKVVRCEVRIIK